MGVLCEDTRSASQPVNVALVTLATVCEIEDGLEIGREAEKTARPS